MSLGKPPRLEHIFPRYDPALYFVTVCTRDRQKILANEVVHRAFRDYSQRGLNKGVAVGRYVIMPDHIHLFVSGTDEFDLGMWIRGLKRVIAAAISGGRSSVLWQRGFFDHVTRNSESYSQKWEYVRENPVRARLVSSPEQWPFQGEILFLD